MGIWPIKDALSRASEGDRHVERTQRDRMSALGEALTCRIYDYREDIKAIEEKIAYLKKRLEELRLSQDALDLPEWDDLLDKDRKRMAEELLRLREEYEQQCPVCELWFRKTCATHPSYYARISKGEMCVFVVCSPKCKKEYEAKATQAALSESPPE